MKSVHSVHSKTPTVPAEPRKLVTYLIAFGGKPKPEFVQGLRDLCVQYNQDCTAALVVPGPGCYNLAFTIPENERFVEMVTMALMPAKWTTTTPIPEGEFRMDLGE